MATETTNGSVPTVEISSKEQAKAIHAQLNKFYRKETGNKRKPKPILNTLGEVENLSLKAKAQKTQTEWEMLRTGMPFVTDITGTLIYVKTGTSRAMCLNTMQSVPVAGGMVHRVFF